MTILINKAWGFLGMAAAMAAMAGGCIVQTDTDDDGQGGAAQGGGGPGGGGAGTPADPSQLFVVNNNSELTSYLGATALSGETPPTTRLSLGASTSLFQPRAAVITESGRLLVARQNGGIVGYDDGATADGETAASVVVEGDATGLGTPIAMAYEASSDGLYVGGQQMENGVLAFTGVSSSAFTGDIPPARVFGPPDRAPYDPTGTILVTIDAVVLDASGSLFVSDTSGDNINNSRILFYDAPAALAGSSEPDQVITSTAWGTIEDMAIDPDGTLYVVSASDTVFVYEAADTLEGEVQPTRTLSLTVSGVSLAGVLVAPSGLGYLADDANHAIYTLDDMAAQSGALEPHRALEGFETRLRNPRKMFLVTP